MPYPAPSPKLLEILRLLQIRMANFRPNINVMDWVGGNLRLEDTTILDGISFVPKTNTWMDLIIQLRIATTADGEKAFVEGRDPEKPAHWAIDASMAATIGIGFREIYRPTLSSRPLSCGKQTQRSIYPAGWSTGRR